MSESEGERTLPSGRGGRTSGGGGSSSDTAGGGSDAIGRPKLSLTEPGTPSSSSKAAGILERARRERAERMSSATDRDNNISVNSSVRASTDRMRELQAQRRENRLKGDTTPGSSSKGRQGPRSPVGRNTASKGARSLDASFEADTDGGEFYDDEGYDEDIENQPEEEIKDLTSVSCPLHIFPLRLLPQSRKDEANTQPLIVIPAPQPPLLQNLSNPVSLVRNAFAKTAELNVISGASAEFAEPINDQSAAGEIEALLVKSNQMLEHGSSSASSFIPSPGTTISTSVSSATPYAPTFNTSTHLYGGANSSDGVYSGSEPLLSNLLLAGEENTASISTMISSNVELSRVTQRTLRELQGALKVEQVRKLFSERSKVPLKDRGIHALAPVHLLRQVKHTPVLRLLENPTISSTVQPVIPTPNPQYGGQLGNWSDVASPKERLGHLALSQESKRSNNRSILRIHVHQLNLFAHPLINDEERLYNNLKRMNVQYCSIFENRTTGYLTYRLFALISELQRAVKRSDEIHPEELLVIKVQYRDLIETLPALCELRGAIDALSSSIYQTWREIQEVRRRQGFSSTRACLTVKKLDSKSGSGSKNSPRGGGAGAGAGVRKGESKSEDKSDAQIAHLAIEEQDWDTLSGLLDTVPSLLKQLQALLVGAENVPPTTTTTSSSSVSGKSVKHTLSSSSSTGVSKDQASAALELEKAALNAKDKADAVRAIEVATECVAELMKFRGLLPEYVLRVSDNGTMTPEGQLPALEVTRRRMLDDLQFKCVVKYNGKEVTSSNPVKLSHSTLTADIHQFFEFRVIHEPEEISLDIYSLSPGTFMKKETFIATVYVPFPGKDNLELHKKPAAHTLIPIAGWYNFAHIPNTGGGADIQGAVFCLAAYDSATSDLSHKQSKQGESMYDGVHGNDIALLPSSKPTMQKWVSSTADVSRERDFQALLPDLAEIDVNDPRSDKLIVLKSHAPRLKDRDVFQLSGYHFSVPFEEGGESYLNYTKFQDTLRMQLLKLRNTKPFLFTEPIPFSDAVIRSSEIYKRLLAKEGGSLGGEDLSLSPRPDDAAADEDDTIVSTLIPGNRAKMTSFLTKVRDRISALKKNSLKASLTTFAVVAETPYFKPLEVEEIDSFIPERKRALKPSAKTRKPQSMQVRNCDVLVQVVGAKNLPLRTAEKISSANKRPASRRNLSGGDSSGSESEGEFRRRIEDLPAIAQDMLDETKAKERQRACTFMEVRFQEHTVRTTTLEGASPLWKQSLALPFRAPHDDFSPSNLIQVTDEVHFTLFDQTKEDDAERGGYLEGEVTTRTEKKYLCSFSIPFATIYNEGRIEGVFRMHTPAFNFGYDHEHIREMALSKKNSGMFEGVQEVAEGGQVTTGPTSFLASIESFFGIKRRALSRKPRGDNSDLRAAGDIASMIHPDTAEEFDYFAASTTSTFVKLMITLDPMLMTNPNPFADVSSLSLMPEDTQFATYAQAWMRDLRDRGPTTRSRNYTVFVTNSKGYKSLLCRYLTAQPPPKGYESRRACVHLVSLIPFLMDSHAFIGQTDLWCTTQEMWEIGGGDEEEHAVALYNYLYYLALNDPSQGAGPAGGQGQIRVRKSRGGKELLGYPTDEEISHESVFLATGSGVPEGDSKYILLRDTRKRLSNPHSPENFILINPCTGHVYSAGDSRCPLHSITTLATPYNLWANIQHTDKPSEMSFDVLNIDHWRPFFGRRLPPPQGGLANCQPLVTYTESSSVYALEVEKVLRQNIKNAVRRWRSKRHRSTTTFHPDASAVMQDVLSELENWKRDNSRKAGVRGSISSASGGGGAGGGGGEEGAAAGGEYGFGRSIDELQQNVKQKLSKFLGSRVLEGCPLNIPFTDIEGVMAVIKTMCVHECQHPDVQFVMAVRAFPVVNNLLSVWVFLGTMSTPASAPLIGVSSSVSSTRPPLRR